MGAVERTDLQERADLLPVVLLVEIGRIGMLAGDVVVLGVRIVDIDREIGDGDTTLVIEKNGVVDVVS